MNIFKAVLVATWVIASFFLGALLALGIFYLFDKLGLSIDSLNDSVGAAVEVGLTYLLAALVAIGVPRALKRSKVDSMLLGLNRLPEWSDIVLGPLGYIPYIILTLILTTIVAAVIPGFNLSEAQDTGFQTVTNQLGYMMAFFTLVVVAPLAEETLFRGYLYGKLRAYIGVIGAIILTSLCFGALHLQLNVAVDVFALSVVLCVLREFTGSIWAGILLHMTKNLIAFYFLFVAPIT
jgi:membrane protease YdiL (CAAX protease family)